MADRHVNVQFPLKKGAHIVGAYDGTRSAALYVDGKQAGHLAVQGSLAPAGTTDVLIGRVRQPTLPVPADAIHPKLPNFLLPGQRRG